MACWILGYSRYGYFPGLQSGHGGCEAVGGAVSPPPPDPWQEAIELHGFDWNKVHAYTNPNKTIKEVKARAQHNLDRLAKAAERDRVVDDAAEEADAAGLGALSSAAGATSGWDLQEIQRLEEALAMYGRDWDRVTSHVGTRSRQSVRLKAMHQLDHYVKDGKGLPSKVQETPDNPKRIDNAGTVSSAVSGKWSDEEVGFPVPFPPPPPPPPFLLCPVPLLSLYGTPPLHPRSTLRIWSTPPPPQGPPAALAECRAVCRQPVEEKRGRRALALAPAPISASSLLAPAF